MRKHLILTLALFLVFVTAMSAKTSSTPQYHRAHGDITATDASAATFTIKHGKESWTFKTDGSTKFKGMGVKTITLADLQVGDNVRVSYTGSGDDKTAARVDVLHGKKTPG
jgi:hypothetical protein